MSTTEQKALAVLLADEQETMLLEVANGERKPGKLLLEPFVRGAAELRRLSAENEALRAQVAQRDSDLSQIHHALNDAGWHPGRTDDLLPDIIRAKGEEMKGLRAQVEALTKALAECRDAFPMPEPGVLLEGIWSQAMGDPESVPGYVKDQVTLMLGQLAALKQVANQLPWFKFDDAPQALTRPAVPDVMGEMEVIASTRYKVAASDKSMFHRHAVVAGDGQHQLYLGREMECESMARKFAGAFLDGAFLCQQIMLAAAPQPSQQEAAQPDPKWEALKQMPFSGGTQSTEAVQPTNPAAENWLRTKYGAYRGHPEWRALEVAFNAGMAAVQKGGE